MLIRQNYSQYDWNQLNSIISYYLRKKTRFSRADALEIVGQNSLELEE